MPKLHQMCGFLCANNAGVLGGTKKKGATVEQRQSITRCDWKEHNQRMDSKKPNPKVEGIYHLIIHNLTNW